MTASKIEPWYYGFQRGAFWTLLLAFTISAVSVLTGTGSWTAPSAQIAYPSAGMRIHDQVDIRGTASGAPGCFDRYKLEYGVGSEPVAWSWFHESTTPVTEGILLANWRTEETLRPNGLYTIRLTVWEKAECGGASAAATILVNAQNPLPSGFRIDPVRDWDPGAGQGVNIKWRLEADGNIQLRIDQPAGACRRVLYPPDTRCDRRQGRVQHFPAGPNQFYWDGHDEDGGTLDVLPDRPVAYFCVMSGTQDPFPVNLPQITDFEVTKAIFDPSEEEEAIFTYRLSSPAAVTVRVFDFQDNLVRNLVIDELQEAGVQKVTWNGRNDVGRFLALGAYKIKVQASNDIGEAIPIFGLARLYF